MRNKLTKKLYGIANDGRYAYPIFKEFTEDNINGYWTNEEDFDIEIFENVLTVYTDNELLGNEVEICTVKELIQQYDKELPYELKDMEEDRLRVLSELKELNEDYIGVETYGGFGCISYIVVNNDYNIVKEIIL